MVLPGLNQYSKQGLMCPAQEHNTVTSVMVQPATPQSRVSHSALPIKWTSKTYEHLGKAGGINLQNMFKRYLKRLLKG